MGAAAATRDPGALQVLLGEYSTEVLPAARRCIEAAAEVLRPGSEGFIAAVPGETQMAAALLVAAGSGGVTGLRTTLALSPAEGKGAFAAASELAHSFRSAGGT